MFRKLMSVCAVMCLWAAIFFASAPAVHAEETVGTLRGRVFVDANENGRLDADEQAMSGIDLEYTNGELIERVQTAQDGTFSVALPAGTWRVSVLAPDGYVVLNDSSREVTLAADGTTEAVLDFALKAPVAVAEAETIEVLFDTTSILPETGASLPLPQIMTLAAFGVLMMAGVLLVAIGRVMLKG